MSESDIDPEDELLIEGAPRAGEAEEWSGADEEQPGDGQPGGLEEREQRQHAVQQHGDTFAVEGDDE
jgi:hypothetical protein